MSFPFRIGQGLDVHRLVEGRKLILGGVEIPYDKGLLGHSDADALLHAITDAVLGAAGAGAISAGSFRIPIRRMPGRIVACSCAKPCAGCVRLAGRW